MDADRRPDPTDLPTGTVTFLFSDIEGSTRLLQELGTGYPAVLQEHRRLLREAFQGLRGIEMGTEGDSFFVVFSSPLGAVAAAVAAQRAMAAHAWPMGAAVRVRMGLHTGEGVVVSGDYVGYDVHRAARIAATGHGGQVLLSDPVRVLVEKALPEAVSIRDLGEHRLKDLADPEHLYQLVIPELRADFPPPRSLDARPNNLPTNLSTFIGRQRELTEVERLLSENRLLTLTGPGGTGKTRLSLEVARQRLTQFDDGAFFVSLAPLTDPALVPSTVALALGLRETGDQPMLDSLRDHLGTREMLLVLDNFEQIVGAAPTVAELLSAPRLKVIVTSREALRLSGEQEYEVPPLRSPDPSHLPPLDSLSQYDAVALFIQRARAVDPAFRVTNENAPAVAEICARLDGLPLAIELAAARMKLFTPQAMLARLESRLALLKGGVKDAPARQQTLRAAIDWSHDLLDPSERTLFRRLAVFAPGCTLEAAEAVAAGSEETDLDVLDGLGSIVDKSLLRRQEIAGVETRFSMLMTIREYATERLMESGEREEMARRHADHFASLADRAEPNLTGPDQATWLDRVEREHDNVRAALQWAIEAGEAETGMRMGGALWRFWHLRGHLTQGRAWLQDLLSMPAASPRTASRAKALIGLASLEYWQADYRASGPNYREAMSIYEDLGDQQGTAYAVYSLAYIEACLGNNREGIQLLRRCLAMYEGMGDRTGAAYARAIMGLFLRNEGDLGTGVEIVQLAVAEFRDLGDRYGLSQALQALASVQRDKGDYVAARATYREVLDIYEEARDVTGVAMLLGGVGHLVVVEGGDPERAVRLDGAGDAAEDSVAGRAPRPLRGHDDARVLVRGQLDEAAIARAFQEGRAMSLEEAVRYARDTLAEGALSKP